MYYVSGQEWKHKDLPRYNIKIAFSNDGKNWIRDGKVCIDFKDDNENALARPYVIFEMEFGKCGSLIKAKTIKLVMQSQMMELIGQEMIIFSSILPSDNSEFDSEMTEYAAVIKYKEMYYMFIMEIITELME